MPNCISCEKETQIYKCTKCAAAYCSLDCYKIHKDSVACAEQQQLNNEATKNAQQAATQVAEEEEPTLYEPFSTDDTVPREKLEQLRNCKELKELLYNPHLRNLLHEIDVSHSAWRAMTAAMQEPLFVEFANACLQVVEPMSAQERKELNL